jgi:hypothetical protein
MLAYWWKKGLIMPDLQIGNTNTMHHKTVYTIILLGHKPRNYSIRKPGGISSGITRHIGNRFNRNG